MWPGPYGEFGSRKYLLGSLDQSLARMGLDYVDIFYSHRFDPGHAAGGDDGRARHGGARGQGALRRHLLLRPAAHRARRPRSCASSGTPLLIHQPSYSLLNRWIEDGAARRARARGHRRDRLLAARAGPAHRPLPARHPGRLARAPRQLLLERDAHRGEPRSRARARTRSPPHAGRALAQMAIAWALRDRARHLGAARREQRAPARAERGGAGAAATSTRTSWRRSTGYAQEGDINLWAPSGTA